MKKLSKILATTLATFIGAMSIFAGSRVLAGFDTPDYNVLTWLVQYNVLLGIISLIVAWFIWRKHKYAITFSSTIILSHASVLLLLLTVFREVAAVDSVKAMTFRMIVWTIILLLTYLSNKNEK